MMPRLDQFITLYLYTPLMRFTGRTRNGFVPILKYHSISSNLFGQSHPYFQINTQPEIFSKQMRWLKSQGYQGIHLSEMFDGLASGLDMSNRVVITFDDVYRDFFTEGFAFLTQGGFQATVFLVTPRLRTTPLCTALDTSLTRVESEASRTAPPASPAVRIARPKHFHCGACRLIPGTRRSCRRPSCWEVTTGCMCRNS